MQMLYTIFYAFGFVLLSPLFVYKMWKRGKYRENFFQRFGWYSRPVRQRLAAAPRPRCWVQAVSVGEVNVALQLLRELQRQMPGLCVVLTTTTSTGYALARQRLPAATELLYFPQDFPWCVRRAFDLIGPDFVVLIESEVWPNHVWTAAARNVPVCLVNARLSPRSAKRHRKTRWLFRRVFSRLALVAAQSVEDAAQLRELGVPPERLQVSGNIKFDASLPASEDAPLDTVALLKQAGVGPTQPVLVAGSTHPGEEEILFDVFRSLRREFPRLFLVLVPRHAERSREIEELASRKQITYALRSELKSSLPSRVGGYDCLLVDTTGELKCFYNAATVIFVGKSLAGVGGQNIVEAAASGRPVVFGPNMQNFQAIARQFVEAGGCVQVATAGELQEALAALLRDPRRREKVAAAAAAVIQANVGATARTVGLIARAVAGSLNRV
jgi:3-deoxy-D-manno-octulosonic-acid transferase